MTDLFWIVWAGISLFNVMLVGHEYASQIRRDGEVVGFKCVAGVLFAPFFLAFTIGYRIKKFPKFKVSIQKDNT
jgi:hypothetical protein